MQQHVLLKIEDNIPTLNFIQEEESKLLTEKVEDLREIFESIGKELGFKDETLEELLLISNEADSEYVTESPDIDTESLEFELKDILNRMLQKCKTLESEYAKTEGMTKELKEEIERNHKMDILASLFSTAYKIIIAKTLLAAYELEINSIKFQTNTNHPRLAERLGRELDALGLDFEVIV